MSTATLTRAAHPDAPAIADLAVTALLAEAELTPKPGLVDGRGPGAHADMTVGTLRDSATALRTAFAECASAAEELELGTDLRAEIGVVGRVGEQTMLAATGGVNTHRGALWALGLLSAGAARGRSAGEAIAFAARLASIPDPALPACPPDRRSHGALVRRRFGVRGAAGEAQAGFPHVTAYALPTLLAARLDGADEDTARLDALLSLIAHLDDTCVLHRGGGSGLRSVQAGAAAVLRSGGCRTPKGRRQFRALDGLCAQRGLSPGGSGDLLAATLFIDALAFLPERTPASCKP
jgi:triphosphoribosyl-dephospho-CoA synthase